MGIFLNYEYIPSLKIFKKNINFKAEVKDFFLIPFYCSMKQLYCLRIVFTKGNDLTSGFEAIATEILIQN